MVQSHTFPATRRLRTRADFSNVHDAKVRETRGPLTIYAIPGNSRNHRMGLSVSRVVGTAPRRNRIKRLLRESFRLTSGQWEGTYDFLVVVRPHAPLKLSEYQTLMRDLAGRLHRAWKKRST